MAKNQKPVLRKGAIINIAGRRWFDRVYGNTYHSVYIHIIDGKREYSFSVPFKYGYDDQYKYTAMDEIWEHLRPCQTYNTKLRKDGFLFFWQLRDFYRVITNVTDVQRKKDL